MNSVGLHDRVEVAVHAVRAHTAWEPEVALILGTGLGALAEEIDPHAQIGYEDIPGFPLSTVESHAGRLLFGSLGGRHAMLVVVPPQVAILGAGRAAPRVVAVDGRPEVHRVLPLSLTVDHRAVAGGEGARFLAAAIADLSLAE